MSQTQTPQKLIYITDEPEMKASGIPFHTTDSARWAFRNRDTNGLAPCFKRIGSRIAIDVPKFFELINQQTA